MFVLVCVLVFMIVHGRVALWTYQPGVRIAASERAICDSAIRVVNDSCSRYRHQCIHAHMPMFVSLCVRARAKAHVRVCAFVLQSCSCSCHGRGCVRARVVPCYVRVHARVVVVLHRGACHHACRAVLCCVLVYCALPCHACVRACVLVNVNANDGRGMRARVMLVSWSCQ